MKHEGYTPGPKPSKAGVLTFPRSYVEALAEENERLRALLVEVEAAIIPVRQGKRDGGTFGHLSIVSDRVRAALAAGKE